LLYAIPVFSEVPDFDLQEAREAIIEIDAIEYKYDFFIYEGYHSTLTVKIT
jgi:hypothetical protein